MAATPRRPRFELDAVALDPAGVLPLYRQLQEQLRWAILDGRLRAGERLPSTRRLAAALGVARNTAAGAYEQLAAEGYLAAAVGSGTRVAPELPERLLRTPVPATGPTHGHPPPLSARGRRVAEAASWHLGSTGPPRPFRPHVPALDAFPRALWERLSARRLQRMPRDLFGAVDPLGYKPLREAIAAYLGASRGVRSDAGQVVVTAGAQQGIELLARMLLDPGDAVWLEDPGYAPARPVFELAGATVVPVPVDADGLDVVAGERLCPNARLAYVTPSSQWPTGVTMPLARRLALLAWAERAGAWVVEDDYTGEFRYAGRPMPALHGLDGGGRVVYLGTFGKVLFPALRIGYLVVPSEMAAAFAAARWLADRHSPPLEQAVLADFIDGGHFARHLRRMRALYAERQGAVVEAVARELAGAVELPAADAGMHLLARATDAPAETALLKAANAAGVELHDVGRYRADGRPGGGLILGYAATPPKAARAAARAWAKRMR